MQRAKRTSQLGSEKKAGRRLNLTLETNVELSKRRLTDLPGGIGEYDETRKLSQRFGDQNTRNDRSFRKVPFEEILVTNDVPARFGKNPDLDLERVIS